MAEILDCRIPYRFIKRRFNKGINAMQPIILYARGSTDLQGKRGLGLEAQRTACHQRALDVPARLTTLSPQEESSDSPIPPSPPRF